jgi:ATP-dependent RNA helicase DeaD
MQTKLFSELGLSPELLKAVERMGFEKASPIQAEAIPRLIAGADVFGQSQTGSGKTAAFGIPAVERVDAAQRGVQVLVLCPTRELATQVAEEIAKLAHFKKGVRELPIYGGASYDRQFRGLQAGPQIVIGTPGRVIDHLQRGTLRIDALRMLVLDEADRMLDMGFREDIERILESVPKERQTVLFSATLPPPIRRWIDRFTRSAEHIKIEAQSIAVPAIDQSYVEADWRSKTEALCRLIDFHDVSYGIIFGATKAQVDELTETLAARGYDAEKLHGDMIQSMRERVMKRFRERKFEFLVATDVAARGLDVEELQAVFNFELPHDPEDYVHRIGRTGRAGRSGRAISLVSGQEYGRLQQIQRFLQVRMRRESVPRVDELEQKAAGRIVDSLRETLIAGGYKKQDELLNQLTGEGHSAGDMVSALMHLLAAETGRPTQSIAEDQPKPSRFERPERPMREGPSGVGRKASRNAAPGDMLWLKFNVGENAGAMPGDFVGCIAGESGLPREVVGTIRMLPDFTLVEVSREHVEQILGAVNGSRLRNRRVAAVIGHPPTGGPPRFAGKPRFGGKPGFGRPRRG